MKKLLVAIVFAILLYFAFPGHLKLALAQENPPIPTAPQGTFILDTLDWLTPEQETEINSINKKLDQEGIAQIAVVTLNDCGSDKKQFRHKLFNSWGIGHANDNDGLLILACWYDGDKAHRSIEQQIGYGLENTLTSTLTDSIAKEYFVPAFQKNQPGNGLIRMVSEYNRLLRNSSIPTVQTNPTISQQQQQQQQQPNSFAHKSSSALSKDALATIFISVVVGLFILAMVVIHIWKILTKRSAHPSAQEKQQEYKELKSVTFLWLILIILVMTACLALTINVSLGITAGLVAGFLLIIFWSERHPNPNMQNNPRPNPKKSDSGDTAFPSAVYTDFGNSFDTSSYTDFGGGSSDFGGGSSGDSGSSSGF